MLNGNKKTQTIIADYILPSSHKMYMILTQNTVKNNIM